MNRLGAVGLVAFVLGVALMVAPGLFPVPLSRAPVYLVGLAAFAQAYRVLAGRLRHGIRRAETPDPEVPRSTPPPGADLREAIDDFVGGGQFYRRHGLRSVVVAVLTRYAGVSEEEARASVDDGTWTDHPLATLYLEDDPPSATLRDRIGRALRRESRHEVSRRRTIEAVAAMAGVTAVELPSERSWRELFDPLDRRTTVPVEDEPRRWSTGHWRGVSALALAAIGLGVILDAAPVVLSGVVGVGFAAYARVSSPPGIDVSIERDLDAGSPDAGDEVDVRLTVRNDGASRLHDLRIVDGAPDALGVASGSPRLGTTLGPGESATLAYAVEARRGVHDFGPVTVLARDLPGSTEASRRVRVETSLTCVPTLRPTAEPVPLRASATRFAGRVQTASGGEGVEFYATRAYQPGDPTNRIDWNRRARDGELATLQFREERSATVVVVVDARSECYRSHEPHAPHAVDRSVEAAGRVVASRLDAGDRVGIAAFGADAWLPPRSGRDHRDRARELLATHPGLSSSPPDGGHPTGWRRRLRRRLPAGAQLVVLSPLCDTGGPRSIRTLDAAGYPTTVISPDPTAVDAPGPLLSTVARRVRVTDLRRAGVPVVDWPPADSLDVALARFERRRSR